ncbi:MAG: hypothetical protein ACOCUP_02835 [bacterium]
MNIKSTFLILFFSFILGEFSVSQIAGEPYRTRITGKPVYNKSTGEIIDNEELSKMFKLNPHIALEWVINKYGEIESFIYDPNKKDNIMRIDTTKRQKAGEQFLPFVMKSVNNRIIDSEKLVDRIVLIQFYHYFRDPFFNLRHFNEFDTLIEDLDGKSDIIFITVTKSTSEEINQRIDITNYKSDIIPDGRYFFWRYLINEFRAFVLIDKSGRLVSYYNSHEIPKLKADLIKMY